MSQYPRVVLVGIEAGAGDGATIYVRKGTIADIPPGWALEAAYGGPSNLRGLTRAGAAAGADRSALAT